jgi:hypothetical protein
MMRWLLSKMFPPRLPKPLHLKEEMPDTLGYQYRMSRTVGIDLGVDKTLVVGVRIKKVTEGKYVQLGPQTSFHYPERERVAIFPTQTGKRRYRPTQLANA